MHNLAVDITNKRFGMLVALYPVANVNGKTAWMCRCDCTNEVVVKTCNLRSGRRTDCGCMRKERLTYTDGTSIGMLRSKKIRRNNTSGVPGVDWRASKNSWRASICFKGKRYYLGSYRRFEDAVAARKKAESELHDAYVDEYNRLYSK